MNVAMLGQIKVLCIIAQFRARKMLLEFIHSVQCFIWSFQPATVESLSTMWSQGDTKPTGDAVIRS